MTNNLLDLLEENCIQFKHFCNLFYRSSWDDFQRHYFENHIINVYLNRGVSAANEYSGKELVDFAKHAWKQKLTKDNIEQFEEVSKDDAYREVTKLHHPCLSFRDWTKLIFHSIESVTINNCSSGISGITKWGSVASLVLIQEAGGNTTGTDSNAIFIEEPYVPVMELYVESNVKYHFEYQED